MKVIIVGDLHGNWGKFNQLINELEQKNQNEELLFLCVGDFGFWPNIPWWTYTEYSGGSVINRKVRNIQPDEGIKKRDNTVVRFCDGNHEDHWALQKLTNLEIGNNIFYQPRGSVLTLDDGRNLLFMGGAHSIDKLNRTHGYDWFPEETICMKDMYNLSDQKIDVVISHTCPLEWLNTMLKNDTRKATDPSNEALSQLLSIYNPSLWFFGHWHHYTDGLYKSRTKWYALDHSTGHSRWWMFLP